MNVLTAAWFGAGAAAGDLDHHGHLRPVRSLR